MTSLDWLELPRLQGAKAEAHIQDSTCPIENQSLYVLHRLEKMSSLPWREYTAIETCLLSIEEAALEHLDGERTLTAWTWDADGHILLRHQPQNPD